MVLLQWLLHASFSGLTRDCCRRFASAQTVGPASMSGASSRQPSVMSNGTNGAAVGAAAASKQAV